MVISPFPPMVKFPAPWVYPVTLERAPLSMIKLLMVLEEVGAVIAWVVTKAPVLSKYDLVIFPLSIIFKILGVPVPVVPFKDRETTLLAVGETVLAALLPGTLTRKSLLVISPEVMVAKAGAAPEVALRYCPVEPLVMEDRVSVAEV